MSETKLCPFAFANYRTSPNDFICVQEKCAWWINDKELDIDDAEGKRMVVPGHCVISDIGRTTNNFNL